MTQIKTGQTTQATNGASALAPTTSPTDDPFRYGYRIMPETQTDGETRYHYLPLTQADFLDPQESDHLTQSDPHLKFVISLVNRFEKYYLQYQPMQPDAQGRLLSETTGVWFVLDETQRDLILIDAVTGEKLLMNEEEYEARLLAEALADRETQRAENERQRAESEQQRADADEAEVARLRALLDKRNGI